MLILSRRIGEAYVIDNGGLVTTTVLDVRGKQVKLGISAPKSIPIDRQEVYLAKQQAKAVKAQKCLVED